MQPLFAVFALFGLDGLMSIISDQLIHLALPALATAAAGYAILLLKRLASKVGLQLTVEQEAAIRERVREAILSVEETMKGANSDDKLAAAVQKVTKTTDLTADEAMEIVHEELPKVRTPAPFPFKVGAR